MLDRAEIEAVRRSVVVGISVGLHPGYNAAQRLYAKRGYIPDGRGSTYHNRLWKRAQAWCSTMTSLCISRNSCERDDVPQSVILLRMAVSVDPQPLIAVRDVRASSRWYGKLFVADSLPDHPHREFYDRVFSSGRLILQLHTWDAEHHPNLVNANAAPPGHGVLLWFQVDDYDSVG